MKIALLGDSIFDNASYVAEGESLSDILSHNKDIEISLLAVDGDVTTDVCKQLERFPEISTLTFVSCGGNDALRSISVLEEKAESVGQALEILSNLREVFRTNYLTMLNSILGKTDKLIVCSIYNEVPGLSESAKSALALFNEIIFEEAFKLNLSVIDLRIVCNSEGDYSAISPIEPSYQGGQKIAKVIERVINNHCFKLSSRVYI